MKVKELIRRLKQENQNLEVQQFAHDHNPEVHDEGTGYTSSVYEITDDLGETFVALST